MQTVWKYPLHLEDSQVIQVPSGAQLLTVQMQGVATIRALVDPSKELKPLEVRIVGTGNAGPDVTGFTYLGTVHVFWKWS